MHWIASLQKNHTKPIKNFTSLCQPVNQNEKCAHRCNQGKDDGIHWLSPLDCRQDMIYLHNCVINISCLSCKHQSSTLRMIITRIRFHTEGRRLLTLLIFELMPLNVERWRTSDPSVDWAWEITVSICSTIRGYYDKFDTMGGKEWQLFYHQGPQYWTLTRIHKV